MEQIIKHYEGHFLGDGDYSRPLKVPVNLVQEPEEFLGDYEIDPETGEMPDGAMFVDATFDGIMSYLEALPYPETIEKMFNKQYGHCIDVYYASETNEYYLILETR